MKSKIGIYTIILTFFIWIVPGILGDYLDVKYPRPGQYHPMISLIMFILSIIIIVIGLIIWKKQETFSKVLLIASLFITLILGSLLILFPD